MSDPLSWTHSCSVSRHDMTKVGTLCHSWGDAPSYEDDCKVCEIIVPVDTVAVKNLILATGRLQFDPKKKLLGRILMDDVTLPGGIQLKKFDRLEPSPDVLDINKFDTLDPPFEARFWRDAVDGRNRRTTSVSRRNPLFCIELGITVSMLVVDVLHTIHLGVAQQYIAFVIWAGLDANVWCAPPGPRSAIIELGIRRTNLDMVRWYDKNDIPLSRRVGSLTNGMLGNDNNRVLKTKAIETITLLPWAMDFVRRFVGRIEKGQFVLKAGECLTEYLKLMRNAPRVVPEPICKRMISLAVQHNQLAAMAGVPMLPKHHIFIHLTPYILYTGNPKYFSNFLDEGLNATIKSIAQCAHRLTWERSIFVHVRLIATVDLSVPFACC